MHRRVSIINLSMPLVAKREQKVREDPSITITFEIHYCYLLQSESSLVYKDKQLCFS